MLTLPRKTRHLQLSNVEVTFAFVLHDGLHEFNDRLHHTRWDNHADVVIEQDILFGVALAFRPTDFCHRVQGSVDVRGLPGAAHSVPGSGLQHGVNLTVLFDVCIVCAGEMLARRVRDEQAVRW